MPRSTQSATLTRGDAQEAVAMYTDDAVHDVVGSPLGVLEGPDAARQFYGWLSQNINTERMDRNHEWYGDDFCVIEHRWHGSVPGEFMGIAGNGRNISLLVQGPDVKCGVQGCQG